MNQLSTTTAYHPALTGLRGLAILLVICFHYFDGLQVFRFGWLGTDVLFVLSGFLITGSLVAHRPHRVSRFAVRRILRIVPIYFLTLAAYFWLMPSIATAAVKQDIVQNSAYDGRYFSFTQNWLFVTNGYPAVPHLAFLWSLGVQVQFYVLMAVITMITTQLRPLVLICAVLMLVGFVLRLNLRFETEDAAFTHYMYQTFARLDSFMAGAIICLLVQQGAKGLARQTAVAGVMAALLLLAMFAVRGTVFYGDIIISTAGLGLIAIAVACLLPQLLNTPTRRWQHVFFTQPPLLFTGRISYGLYMYHVLIFTFVSNRITAFIAGITGRGLTAETLAAFICLVITFILAWFSYRLIEKPLLRIWKNN